MGMLLSVPLLLHRRLADHPRLRPALPCRDHGARPADRPTHRAHRPDLARRLHGRGAGPSAAGLLPQGAARRRRRRLHHRAGNLPDVRRAFGRLARRALAGDGTSTRRAAGRAGTGTRHLDGRCLARHARRAGLPCRHRSPSRRDQRAAARRCRARPSPPIKPTWHARFDDVPEGPLLLVANEFFDALPVRQFEKTAHGWTERMVGLDDDGNSAPGAGARCDALRLGICPRRRSAPQAEICEAGLRPGRQRSASASARHGGWALIVDYGHDGGLGASLQAVRGHRGADILDRPGETDLSAHVDFAALARATGRPTFGPIGPGRLPAAARHRRARRRPESPRQRGPARGDRCGVGSLDRARPNGHPLPRFGRGRRQKRRAGRLFGYPSD